MVDYRVWILACRTGCQVFASCAFLSCFRLPVPNSTEFFATGKGGRASLKMDCNQSNDFQGNGRVNYVSEVVKVGTPIYHFGPRSLRMTATQAIRSHTRNF